MLNASPLIGSNLGWCVTALLEFASKAIHPVPEGCRPIGIQFD